MSTDLSPLRTIMYRSKSLINPAMILAQSSSSGKSTPQVHARAVLRRAISSAYQTLGVSDVVIAPIPYELTTSYGQGTVEGPAACIEASAQVELYDDLLKKNYQQEKSFALLSHGMAKVQPYKSNLMGLANMYLNIIKVEHSPFSRWRTRYPAGITRRLPGKSDFDSNRCSRRL